MTPQDLRKQFEETHPGKRAMLLRKAAVSPTYGEWLESRILAAEQTLQWRVDMDNMANELANQPDCCPKCGSMDVIWTCYCNKCKEVV